MLLSVQNKIDEVFSSWESFLSFFIKKIYEISGLQNLSFKTIGFFVLVTIVSLFVEYILIKDKRKSSLSRLSTLTKSTLTDIISWILSGLGVFNFIGVIMTLGVFYLINWLLTKDINVFATDHIKLDWLQFVVVFILSDLKGYWNHRMFHTFRPLWELHAFHHSATEFNVMSAQRGHFVEAAIVIITDTLFWKLIGASPINIIYIAMLVQVQQGLLHSNLTQHWGFLGRLIFVSPSVHRIHHSVHAKHYNKNYGVVFIFWDKLFGTYSPPEESVEIGIPNNPYNKSGFISDIWIGYKRFLKQLFKFRSDK